MPKKSKGRGRGRGRATQQAAQQRQVGQQAAAATDLRPEEHQASEQPGHRDVNGKSKTQEKSPQKVHNDVLPPGEQLPQKVQETQPSRQDGRPQGQDYVPSNKNSGQETQPLSQEGQGPDRQEQEASQVEKQHGPCKGQGAIPKRNHRSQQEQGDVQPHRNQGPQGHVSEHPIHPPQTQRGQQEQGPQGHVSEHPIHPPQTQRGQQEQGDVRPHRNQGPQGHVSEHPIHPPQTQRGQQEQGPQGHVSEHPIHPPQTQRGQQEQGDVRPLSQTAPLAGTSQVQTPGTQPGSAAKSPKQQSPGNGGVYRIDSDEKTARHRQETLELPKRPGYGTEGRQIALKANFFEVSFPRVDYLFHYDVEISPEKVPISECRNVVQAAINAHQKTTFKGHKPAFDGRKNLYSRVKLPVDPSGVDIKVTLPGRDGGKDRHFQLKIKYAAQVSVADLKKFLAGQYRGKIPQETVQGLDIILRQIPSLHFTPVGRSFFPPPDGSCAPLGGGCEIWTGFYQSIRPSQWKTMLLNIDVSSKGFQKCMPVVEYLAEMLNIRNIQELDNKRWQMDKRQSREFHDDIKGLRVETCHIPGMKRKYTVMDLSKPAANNFFELVEGSETREISVEKYFDEKYRIKLRYPHLPCLVVGQKRNCLPMEVCQMVPTQRRKLTEEQTRAMIKRTARPAPERKRDISQWVNELDDVSHQYLRDEYGMSINKNMVDVKGRVLPAPRLKLGGETNNMLVPRDGSWDMRGKQFYKGMSVETWALVCFADPKWCGGQKLENFSRQMEHVCKNEGMVMAGRPCVAKYARFPDQIGDLFAEFIQKYQGLQLIVVALPDRGNKDVYKEVKHIGDTVLGIATQCIQMKQFLDSKPQVCSNIAMKINAKLGGTNHVIDPSLRPPIFKEPVIIFGADVTHPSPGESSIPSIAAVVASLDPHASRYCARVRPQTHMKNKAAQEIILDLAQMVKELMKEFYKKNQRKPRRIVFYRDGVSEGQFEQVLLQEVRAVQQACYELEKDYQPPITFVVVQKRHHARLFCANEREACGKSRNVPAGTTVDSGIVHPFEFDFYLCSHFGIQGTSRPTHYHVIYDDNNFTANDLQKLTYQLCHTYARCTRSVSMPAPAYYAHLAAFRARHLVNGGVSSSGGPSSKSEEAQMREYWDAIKVEKKMESAMYFT